jgi:dihydroneopterin aldolase
MTEGRGRFGDRIELRGLRADGVHGVLAEEKEREQPFEVDLDLAVDLGPASRTDRLGDTVDYGLVAEAALGVVRGPPSFELIEAMADAVAAAVLAVDDRVERVTVRLRKLEPPLEVDISSVGVRLTRGR